MKRHPAASPHILLTFTIMAFFNARAGSPSADKLPDAEKTPKAVRGTPLDRQFAEKAFETATFGIG